MARPPGSMAGHPWTMDRVTRINGTLIAVNRAARGPVSSLLQRLQFTLSQVILPLLPGPLLPFALEILPVGLKAVQLIEDGVRILVGRQARCSKNR